MKLRADRRKIQIAAMLLIVVLMLICFSACDSLDNYDREYGVYVKRIDYDKESHTMTAVVYLTSEETKALDGVSVSWHFEKHKMNAFFNRYDYVINFDPSTIFSVVDASLTQEQRNVDDVEFDVLKVSFEYATIYKSMIGSETRRKSGNYYVHIFPLDESQTSFQTTLSLRVQNSATWYGILIASAVAVFCGFIAIILLRRNRYAKQERTENQ